jgi:hypothetical protein
VEAVATHEDCVGQWIGPCRECGWTTAWFDGKLLTHLDKSGAGEHNACSVLAWYRENMPEEPVRLPGNTPPPGVTSLTFQDFLDYNLQQCRACHGWVRKDGPGWVCPQCRTFNLDRRMRDA